MELGREKKEIVIKLGRDFVLQNWAGTLYYRTWQEKKEIAIELSRENILQNWARSKRKLLNWAGTITELGGDFVLQNSAGRKRDSNRTGQGQCIRELGREKRKVI